MLFPETPLLQAPWCVASLATLFWCARLVCCADFMPSLAPNPVLLVWNCSRAACSSGYGRDLSAHACLQCVR
eukprot:4538887-Amphidinium_carterae.1